MRDEFDKKHQRYEGYIDRLEKKAGNQFKPTEEGKECRFLSLNNLFNKVFCRLPSGRD